MTTIAKIMFFIVGIILMIEQLFFIPSSTHYLSTLLNIVMFLYGYCMVLYVIATTVPKFILKLLHDYIKKVIDEEK